MNDSFFDHGRTYYFPNQDFSTMVRIPLHFFLAVMVIVRADRLNKSATAGVLWSAAEEEGDLLRKAEPEETTLHNEEFDGGFSSLDSMLQWAIGHSDLATLKETAENVQHLPHNELKKRQVEIKEVMEKLKMPSDAQLMQIAIDDLNNSSLSYEDRRRALKELLILVEAIENANDLNKLGGLAVVIRELNHPETEIRTASAWILGVASQNNPVVQQQALQLGALTRLMKMVKSSHVEEATKALFAVSALIRNNLDGQELFYAEAGDLMLQDILSNSSFDIRLRKKSVFLVGDLAKCYLETRDRAEVRLFSSHIVLKSLVDLMTSTDLDLQEKALVTIKNLLQIQTTDAPLLKNIDLDGALKRVRQQFQKLMREEQKEYAMDLESLCREVEMIFHRKLGIVQHG